MEPHQHDYITQLAISKNPEIEEILKRIPDEKLNTSTTGRSNAPFLISTDRNSGSIVHTEPTPEVFDQNTSQNQNPNVLEVNDSHNVNSPSFHLEDNREFNLGLLSETIKCEEIISNSSGILVHFLVGSMIFFLYLKLELSISELFIGLIIMEVLSLAYNIFRHKRRSLYLILTDSFFLEYMNVIFVTCLIYISLDQTTFKTILALLSYPFVHVLWWYKKNLKRRKPYFFLILGVRIFVFLQLMQLSMKLDHLINWEWKNVFWMTWIVLVTIGFYLMGLFILLVLTAYYTYKGDADSFQLKGLFWCFSNISDFSVSIFLILLSLIKYLHTGDDGFAKIALLLNIGWSFGNLTPDRKFINILITERNEGDAEGNVTDVENPPSIIIFLEF